MINLLNLRMGKRKSATIISYQIALTALAGLLVMACPSAGAQAGKEKPTAAKAKTIPATQPQQSAKQPIISCNQPVYEFPERKRGEKVKHTFVIRNLGDAPLVIKRINSGCKCTAVKDYPKSIPPKGQGNFTFNVDTNTSSRIKTVTPSILSNDPKTPELKLAITGKLIQPILMEPSNGAQFGSIRPNQKIQPKKVVITNTTTKPMKLVSTPTRGTTVYTWTMEEKEPGKTFELTVTPHRPFRRGNNYSSLIFKTGIPQSSKITVPCNLFSLPLVETSPPSGLFIRSPVNPNTPFPQGKLLVKYNGDGEMKIKSAKTKKYPNIKVEVKPETAGKSYYVFVDIPKDFKSGARKPAIHTYSTLADYLVITTDVQTKPIEIPIRIAKARKRPTTTRPVRGR